MNESINNGTILVPIKGTASDEEVLRMATLLAKKKGAKIYALSVVVVKQDKPLECDMPQELAHAEKLLQHFADMVREMGVEVETGILQARSAGVAIVEEALERNVKLIMMPVTYRSRLGEFCMGKTVPYVLKNAPCRVWTFRDEISQANSTPNGTVAVGSTSNGYSAK